MEIIISLLYGALIFTIQASILIILTIVLSAMAVHYINMKAVSFAQIQLSPSIIKIVILPSVVFHEMCHAAMCSLFGHRIEKISFFNSENQRGYVLHSYNIYNPVHRIGNFFIGLAPIILGAGILYLAGKYFVPTGIISGYKNALANPQSMLSSIGLLNIFTEVYNGTIFFYSKLLNGGDIKWGSLIYIYLVFVLSSAMRVSPEDARSTFDGIKILTIVIFIIHIVLQTVAIYKQTFSVSPYQLLLSFYSFVLPIVLFALLINSFFCAGLYLSLKTSSKVVGKTEA